jgi:phage baseplate assembly protein W
METNILGKGLAFPIQLVNGIPQLVQDVELIKQSLRILLSWSTPRFMLYEFRSRLFELLEEPNDDVLKDLIRYFVVEMVVRFEPRVTLLEAKLTRANETTLHLNLTYQIISSNTIDSFIYPFYTNKVY